jgi:hypothetical protein
MLDRLIGLGAGLLSRLLARWNRAYEVAKEDGTLRTAVRLIACLLVVSSLRCPPLGQPHLEYESARESDDDGYVAVLTDSLPGAVAWVCGGTWDVHVGVLTDTAGRTVVSRALYRFPDM